MKVVTLLGPKSFIPEAVKPLPMIKKASIPEAPVKLKPTIKIRNNGGMDSYFAWHHPCCWPVCPDQIGKRYFVESTLSHAAFDDFKKTAKKLPQKRMPSAICVHGLKKDCPFDVWGSGNAPSCS